MTITIEQEGNLWVARRSDSPSETGRSDDIVKSLEQIGLVWYRVSTCGPAKIRTMATAE